MLTGAICNWYVGRAASLWRLCHCSMSVCVIDEWPVCDWVQSATWPSGKGLGGTSLLNYMQYLRGSRHDYDAWANSGAAGWAYKDVLPYFIKAEDQQNGEFVRTGRHSSSADLQQLFCAFFVAFGLSFINNIHILTRKKAMFFLMASCHKRQEVCAYIYFKMSIVLAYRVAYRVRRCTWHNHPDHPTSPVSNFQHSSAAKGLVYSVDIQSLKKSICQMSSKPILIILRYTVSKFARFFLRHSV